MLRSNLRVTHCFVIIFMKTKNFASFLKANCTRGASGRPLQGGASIKLKVGKGKKPDTNFRQKLGKNTHFKNLRRFCSRKMFKNNSHVVIKRPGDSLFCDHFYENQKFCPILKANCTRAVSGRPPPRQNRPPPHLAAPPLTRPPPPSPKNNFSYYTVDVDSVNRIISTSINKFLNRSSSKK